MKRLTLEEIAQLMREDDCNEIFLADAIPLMQQWLDRGDGIAVYQNQDLGHPQLGHHKYVSYGSTAAQLETDEPPERLPDIGGEINWCYTLMGVCRGESIEPGTQRPEDQPQAD